MRMCWQSRDDYGTEIHGKAETEASWFVDPHPSLPAPAVLNRSLRAPYSSWWGEHLKPKEISTSNLLDPAKVLLNCHALGVDPLSSYWFNGSVSHPVQIDDQDEGRGSKQADDGVDIRVKVMAEKLDLIERGYSLQLCGPTSEVNKVIFFEDLCDLVRPLHDHNFELHRRTRTYAATMPSKRPLPLYFHPPVLTGTLPTLHCLKTKHLLHTP
ncbi:hypothetical protein K435DRAFT_869304 [Dendrothele bispora CBS 962.96]|uniref:Uncharacterized protein n=1 Tax=Dendrothele bispora (strain CBS 962.96) TaxID=1314807 RepID=A0A4S8L9M6_DENBC|nr:hypothetical protein K435DRAFT_869304 [Dendrothele bispora CBS 962.96]